MDGPLYCLPGLCPGQTELVLQCGYRKLVTATLATCRQSGENTETCHMCSDDMSRHRQDVVTTCSYLTPALPSLQILSAHDEDYLSVPEIG